MTVKPVLTLAILLGASTALADRGAELRPCSTWPGIASASGPGLAATGLPFTLNLRLSCLLNDSYSILGLKAGYHAPTGSQLLPTSMIYPFPLPAGDILYQFLFEIPEEQPGGAYSLSGCVRILEKRTGLERCLPIQAEDITVVSVPAGRGVHAG